MQKQSLKFALLKFLFNVKMYKNKFLDRLGVKIITLSFFGFLLVGLVTVASTQIIIGNTLIVYPRFEESIGNMAFFLLNLFLLGILLGTVVLMNINQKPTELTLKKF